MAALSFYSNSDSSSHLFSPDFFDLTPPQLDHFPTDSTSLFPNVFPNVFSDVFSDVFPGGPFLNDASSFLYSDYYNDNFIPISSDEFHCSKRQKIASENEFFMEPSVFCHGSYFPPAPELLPWNNEESGMVFESEVPVMKKLPQNNNLSAQSIAARERRRKITAKTQELGELIPGGNKMNTAEMFHSAFKYVKFLQAQIAILQLMQETEEEEEEQQQMGEIQILESPVIQEKLYCEEKCLVPTEFVQNLASFSEIQTQPSMLNSINQILQTSS